MKLCCKTLNVGIILFLVCGFSAHASNVYVSDSSNGTIVRFDSGGNESVFASGLDIPEGLAFDDSGNLYVTDSGNGTILRFNSSGSKSVFASGLNDPAGLAFDNNGDLYVANQGNGTILQFNSSGQGTIFASGLGINADPTYLAFDSQNNLYVTTTRTIEKFNPSGSQSTVFSTLEFVYGIAFDNVGDLYASLQNAGSIIRILGGGGPSTPLRYPYDVDPYELAPLGLAFDGNGNLYAILLGYFGGTLEGAVMEFNSSGNGSFLGTGLSYGGGNYGPNYVAIQNTQSLQPVEFVPEPSTWTLIIAGLAILEVSRRLHRRSFSSIIQRQLHYEEVSAKAGKNQLKRNGHACGVHSGRVKR